VLRVDCVVAGGINWRQKAFLYSTQYCDM